MRIATRIGTTAMAGILTLAMLMPSATAVAPSGTPPAVRCSADPYLTGSWGRMHWKVSFTLKNTRSQPTTVSGSWQVDLAHRSLTIHHHADLMVGARTTFRQIVGNGWRVPEPTIDLLGCR